MGNYAKATVIVTYWKVNLHMKTSWKNKKVFINFTVVDHYETICKLKLLHKSINVQFVTAFTAVSVCSLLFFTAVKTQCYGVYGRKYTVTAFTALDVNPVTAVNVQSAAGLKAI